MKGNDTLFIGDDYQQIDYNLSPCCSPIPGDAVFGFLTINEGIKIHRTTCPNPQQLLSSYGNRVIKATWSSQVEKSYPVKIYLEGLDRSGVISEISKIINKETSIDMTGLNVNTEDGIFEGSISLTVGDTKNLDKLMKKLNKVHGIDLVTRIRNENS